MDDEVGQVRRRMVTPEPEQRSYDGQRRSRSRTRSYSSILGAYRMEERQRSLDRKFELIRILKDEIYRERSELRHRRSVSRRVRSRSRRVRSRSRRDRSLTRRFRSSERSPTRRERRATRCEQSQSHREQVPTRREQSPRHHEWSSTRRERRPTRRERSPTRRERSSTRRERSTTRHEQCGARCVNSSGGRERSMQAKRLDSPAFSTHDVMNLLSSLKSQPLKVSNAMNGKNMLAEFDPSAKGQRVEIWLKKVNESATVYGWDDKTTIHFAMQKLQGLAKCWYEGLNTILYSWPEWQEKLISAFPSDDNFGQSLENMINRKSKPSEAIEAYYYDKLALLNQCEIDGHQAVDCIIHGLSDRMTKTSALALRCTCPDQLLKFLVSNKNNSSFMTSPDKNSNGQGPTSSTNMLNTKSDSHNARSNVTCYNCKEPGHPYSLCTKPIKKCMKCGRVGHEMDKCKDMQNQVGV